MTMVLAIDTTGSRPAIVTLESGDVSASWQGGEAQTPLLDGMRELLQQMDLPAIALPQRISIVGVATGPGRYARLRAGVAFAKGLAAGLPARLVGVPSAAAISHAAGQPTAVVIPAGRGRFYLLNANRPAGRGRFYLLNANRPDNEPMSAQELAGQVAPDARVAGDVDDATARDLSSGGAQVIRIAPLDVAAAVGRLAADQTHDPAALAVEATQPIYMANPVHD